MARRTRFPWGVAALIGAAAYLLTRTGLHLGPRVWTPSPDNWMAAGGVYRWSTQRFGGATPAQIVAALQASGYRNVTVWQGSALPADWPAEQGITSGQNHLEVTATAPLWVGPSVTVWSGQALSAAQPAPSAPAALLEGNRVALIAQGTIR